VKTAAIPTRPACLSVGIGVSLGADEDVWWQAN
jgi:hypothetical protein